MRKITYMLSELRKGQLSRRKAPDERIAEVDAAFNAFDNALDGIHREGDDALVREVMTSADFTYAIEEFVQRKSLPGYQRMAFEFEPLVKMENNLPNYLEVTRYQNRCGVDDLEYVGEKAPARAGSVQDATKRTLQVWRFEKQFDFSHEALVNDDIGYFENQATLMGEAARRTLEKYVSRFYTNGTSITRIQAGGANYTQNGRLTSTRISEARMGFGQRVDDCNEPINADLAFIVYPRGLEDTVRQIQASTLVPELATNAANIVRTAFVGIKDPYIATPAPPTMPWYAFDDPNNSDGIVALVLARRSGMPGPAIVRKTSNMESVTSMLGAGSPMAPIFGDFESGNIVVKVMDAWGTYVDGTNGNIFDRHGTYYSAGTAP